MAVSLNNLPSQMIVQEPTCPICGQETFQLAFRLRSYWNDTTDVDLQPINFVWKDPSMNAFHPPLYDMWYCAHCYFTSDNKNFAEPAKSLNIMPQIFKQVLAKKLQDEELLPILKKLGKGIDFCTMDFYQAIRLNLLAIFILRQIPTLVDKDTLRLGKYFMRLAWLYRDLSKTDQAEAVMAQVKTLTDPLKGHWKNLPQSEEEAIILAVKCYDNALSYSEEVENPIMEINLQKLLAKIYLRRQDYKQAQKYLKTAINAGSNEKANMEATLRATLADESKMSDDERKPMVEMVRQLGRNLDEANTLLHEVTAELMAKQKPIADKIAAQLAGQSPDVIKAAMEKEQIEPKLIQKYLPKQSKKKGFFGSLFGG